MKTAISVPDDVFAEAERFARKAGKTRSQLYSDALRQYLLEHAPDAVTQAMNAACEKLDQQEDGFVRGVAPDAAERIMVDIAQGEIWWAELDEPTGSAAGFRRPVVVVQGDALNRSRLATVLCVPLTSNLNWAEAPGNVSIPGKLSGLRKHSVANVSQIVAIDRRILTQKTGRLPRRLLELILSGIDIMLGR